MLLLLNGENGGEKCYDPYIVTQHSRWHPLPRVRHPEQADRLPLVGRPGFHVTAPGSTGGRLPTASPGKKPVAEGKLTPYRVRRAFSSLLGQLPPLATLPNPCGRSPGRPKGRLSGLAPRFPAVKKAA